MDTSHRNNVPLCEDDDDLWYWGYSIFVPHIPNTRAYPYVSRIMVQTPSTALPASSCNTSGRQRHRKADGSMWSCREMASMRSASSDGTRTRPCWSGRYTGCCCWMATSTPSPSGRCCRWWRHYAAVCLVPEKNPLVRIDLTRGLMYVALYEQECFSRKLNDMKLNTPFNIFCHRFKM